VDCTTERTRSPHTLVCKKNTKSYKAALKKYHEDLEHLARVREIEGGYRTEGVPIERLPH
jgi:hypothetical protein